MTFVHLLTEFGTVVAALIIVLDPFALIPIILDVISQLEPPEARRTVLRVVGGATVLLLVFTVSGTYVLRLFGVTLDDLRVAGGLLLLVFSLKLVFEGSIGIDRQAGYRAALVPLISPLLVGPGAITAAIVLAASHGVILTSLAAIAAMLISLALLLLAPFIYRLVGEIGTDLISRIMGLLIAAIAVSYIREGIVGLVMSKGSP